VFLFFGIASTIWFGIKPAYESSIINERISLVSEYHREKVDHFNDTFSLWLRAVTQIERDLKETGSIQNVKVLFLGYHAIIPNFVALKITEEATGKYLNIRSEKMSVDLPKEEIVAFHSSIIHQENKYVYWDEMLDVLSIISMFNINNEVFRVTAFFDVTSLQNVLFNHDLGIENQAVLWLNKQKPISTGHIPNHTPEFQTIPQISQESIDGAQTIVISSGLSYLPASYKLYLNHQALQAPVEKLFVQSIWILGFAFFVLIIGSTLFFSQISKPINQFVNELQPFTSFDFSVPIKPTSLPEFHAVSVKMEDIRLKLSHYQKINVEKIISSEQKYKLLMEHATDPIAVFDGYGTFTSVNVRFKQLFEDLNLDVPESITSFEQILELTIIHERSKKTYKQDPLLIHTKSAEIKLSNEKTQQYFFHYHVVELKNDDNVLLGGQLSLYDLTHERELERTKNDMIHFIIHEFKNPLSGIQGLISLLKEGLIEENEIKEYYDLINDSVAKLFNFVNRFLDVSKIEASSNIPIDVYHIYSEVPKLIDEVSVLANENRIRFNLQNSINEPIMASTVFMNDVITNLITNAIKYGEPDRTIDIEIKLDKRVSTEKVIFEITDYGFGIEEEDRDLIFKKFQRVKKHTYIQGTGLGLAYVKEIVSKHGGDIILESNEKIGCRFTMWIPYIAVENHAN